ncbi:MAG: integrase [Ahrensia sp.]|nr:integrase [Ahrensia sp.]
MARNLLTALAIKKASKAKLRDGDGLWLHTSRAGNRYWVFIYTRKGRRREMGLGPLGTGTGQVSLTAARAKADEIRTILGSDGDPFTEMEERRVVAKLVTFGDIADEYIDAMKARWRGAKTEAGWRNTLTVHAKPLRKIPVSEIATDDVVRCLKPIWQTKTETASKTRERIKIVLDHAKARGLRNGENPAEWKGHLDQILVAPTKLARGHHAAMPYADLPDFYTKLAKADGIGARALEFAILTACRSGEVRGAVWDEIDMDASVWTIPADRMKAGKMHRVPLSDHAVAILQGMKKLRISRYVFPGKKVNAPLSDMTLSKALKTAAGEGFTVHGFRSSFRDWVSEETDFQTEVAEAALAHTTGDTVERAYRRGDVLAKRREMMAAWAEYVGGADG